METTDDHISKLSNPLPLGFDMARSAPACIGVIMDGNRRWAKETGVMSLEGHRAGAEKIKEAAGWARDAGVQTLICYTFSTENWHRPEREVSYLMDLLESFLKKETAFLKKEGIRLRVVGEREKFSPRLRLLMEVVEKETAAGARHTLVLALSYGGRAEILAAANRAIAAGERVDETSFKKYFWTEGIADPDLIIRTGGERRLSGFLPWQGVYSELFFVDTKWPAFSKEEFLNILNEYGTRERRMGR